MASLDVGGYWWLPDHADRQIPGTLKFDPIEGATLHLIGALAEVEEFAPREELEGGAISITITEEALENSGIYSRILGVAEGKAYTLDDCFQTHRSGGFFGPSHRQVIYVNRVFEGAHFGDEILGGDGLEVDYDWLHHWVSRTGLKEQVAIDPQADDPVFVLQGHRLPVDRATIVGGGELSLNHHLGLEGKSVARTISQRFSFQIHYPSVITSEELIDVASDLQDLISIGTGRIAAYDTLKLFHPDIIVTNRVGQRKSPITLLARWAARSGVSKPLSRNDMFFSMEDLGGMPGVVKWLNLAKKHRDTLGRVMATRYEGRMYVSDRYLNRLASLEALNRKESNDGNKTVSLERRLRRCVNLAGRPCVELVPDTEQWIKILKRDRDDIAHHYGRRLRQETAEQYFLAESAYWLYVCCLLRLAEAPEAVFDRIMGNQEYAYLQSRLKRFLIAE